MSALHRAWVNEQADKARDGQGYPRMLKVYRGYEIWQTGPTSFRAADNDHGSLWSATCYIDELLASLDAINCRGV